MTRKPFLFFFIIVLITGCDKFADPDTNYSYSIPESNGNDLAVSSLTAEGLDENVITNVTNLIVREKYKRIDALLILRNNKLVYENYFHGYSQDIPHNIFSAGKSITSILTGIAIDKGFIENADQPIAEFLPEYESQFSSDPKKKEITIRHVLNMSSGLACDDWYQQTETEMQKSDDWVKFTLSLPLVNEPGLTGSYCTGGVVTLGRVIENASGMSLEEFANEFLFGPLNISEYKFHEMPDGKSSGGGLLFLAPRAMAKIGLLMLNNGMWEEERIVSEDWIAKCSESQLKLTNQFDGYGYLWWKQSFSENVKSYFADGNGGQHIFVIPSKQLVIVFTGGNQNTGIGLQNFEIVNKYILPSL